LPELPEVEAVRRALRPVVEGARFDKVVARRPDLRVAFPARFTTRLEGQTVRALDRRGKYLLAELSSRDVLVMHLGMSGSFRVEQGCVSSTPGGFHHDRRAAVPHDHVVFWMSSGATVTFNDPRRFGYMDLVAIDELAAHPVVGALGPEPLSGEFTPVSLARSCRGKRTSLKAALLDQRVVAGLGNIYVSEALHRARLSPRRRASTIATRLGAPRDAARRLTQAIKETLNDAINRSEAWQTQRGEGDESAYFPNRFRVYDREGQRCRTRGCPGFIRRIVQGGRSTFYCAVCQK
jgi:formamidopyrimidine-DNA glycosylase